MSFIAAGIAAAGAIGGAIINSNAADSAADQQAQAAREANALQKQMYDQSRADAEPWRAAGGRALSGMENADFQRDFTAADFQQDPGYQFRMQEGQKALERSAAARGGLQTGGTLKALAQYGQNFASNEYQNAYNRFNADRDRRFGRLNSLAGMGQNAVSGLMNANQNYANQAGANITGAGNAAAASTIAGANAWNSGISSIGNIAGDTAAGIRQNNWMDQWLKKQGSQT